MRGWSTPARRRIRPRRKRRYLPKPATPASHRTSSNGFRAPQAGLIGDHRHDARPPTVVGSHHQRRRPAARENVHFNSLLRPIERKLFAETAAPPRRHELTQRAIDLIAPIGWPTRAHRRPGRAGKTTLSTQSPKARDQPPNARSFILLVDERPEEVSRQSRGASAKSFVELTSGPAPRQVTEMVLNRAHAWWKRQGRRHRPRFAHAHGTRAQHRRTRHRTHAVRWSRRHGNGAESVLQFGAFDSRTSGGGSLTIIAGAGRNRLAHGRRDFENPGTGSCIARSQPGKRIYRPSTSDQRHSARRKAVPAGTRSTACTRCAAELSRSPQSAMEWLIKRIAALLPTMRYWPGFELMASRLAARWRRFAPLAPHPA